MRPNNTQHVQIQIKTHAHTCTHKDYRYAESYSEYVFTCCQGLAWRHRRWNIFSHSTQSWMWGCCWGVRALWRNCFFLNCGRGVGGSRGIRSICFNDTSVHMPNVAWHGKSRDDHYNADVIAKPGSKMQITLQPEHEHKPVRKKVIGIYGIIGLHVGECDKWQTENGFTSILWGLLKLKLWGY